MTLRGRSPPINPPRQPSGWGKLAERLPIQRLHLVHERLVQGTALHVKPIALIAGQTVSLGSNRFTLQSVEPLIATLQLRNQAWTMLGRLSAEQQQTLMQSGNVTGTQVLWWSGQRLQPELVAALRSPGGDRV